MDNPDSADIRDLVVLVHPDSADIRDSAVIRLLSLVLPDSQDILASQE